MNKYILALLTLFMLFSYPAKAKNSIVIRVSCTIPKLITISKENNSISDKENTIQYQKTTRNGEKVLLKTVVAK